MLTLTYTSDHGLSETASHRQVNVWYDEQGGMYARAFSCGTSHRIEWTGVGVFAFGANSTEVRVSPAADVPRPVLEDTFTRLLQPIILQALGWQALHASAVLGPSGVWAFCGRSGAGKSTLAYALQRAGFDQVADDALVMSVGPQRVSAHALPFIPRLEAPSREHFQVEGPVEIAARATATPVPVSAIFLLQRNIHAAEPTRVTPIQPAQAFASLLTHAHCFDAEDQDHVKKLTADYLSISETVPVFSCAYRPGLQFLPELIDCIEDTGTRADPRPSRA